MSYKYYQKTLEDSIQYRIRRLDVDTDISNDLRKSCKDDLSNMQAKVQTIITGSTSNDDKVKALQACILEMNVGQIGIA